MLSALQNFSALVRVSVSVLGTVVGGLNYSPRCLCTKIEALSRAEHSGALLDTCSGWQAPFCSRGSTRAPSTAGDNQSIAPKLPEVVQDAAAFPHAQCSGFMVLGVANLLVEISEKYFILICAQQQHPSVEEQSISGQ